MSRIKTRLGNVIVGDNYPIAVMGVINLDPQSFYQSSFFPSLQKAISAAERMVDEGVDIIDIGGVSTAPGSFPVSIEEETKRVRSTIRSISQHWDIPVSIDTQSAKVAQVALSEGATIVNDVSGLKSDSSMAATIKDAGASCILMAAETRPGDQHAIPEILSALQSSIQIAQSAGISEDCIAIDPGLGFGKPIECDLAIIRNLRDFRVLNLPILLGVSRKYFIGQVLIYNSPDDRLYGTVAASTIAILNGVHVLRTHDIRASKDCIKMVTALQTPQECE
jgi:dihydropteroate synthase